jgi:hypothetical protein
VQSELHVSALLGRLAGASVDFVVIGGVAVIAQGYERNTKALDICYSPDRANLEALSGSTSPTSKSSSRRSRISWR